MMSIHCSVCGQDNADNAQVCSRCGVTLVKSGLALTSDFELRLSGEDRSVIHLAAPAHEGYVLGRSDAGSEYVPDIDLASYGARERGVSRRHAALVRYKSAIHIVDLESVNGTFLNGERLLPETPYPLNLGDDLRLGHLVLHILPARR